MPAMVSQVVVALQLVLVVAIGTSVTQTIMGRLSVDRWTVQKIFRGTKWSYQLEFAESLLEIDFNVS